MDRSANAPVNCFCVGAGAVGDVVAAVAGEVAATVAAGAAAAAGAVAAGLGCFTSHASSSNPRCTGFSAAAGVEGDPTRSWVLGDVSFCSKTLGSTTSPVWTAGAGLLFRVLLCNVPPGPEKRPLAPPSSPLPMTSSPPKLTFLALDLEPVRFSVASR